MQNITPAVKILLAINFLLFLLTFLLGENGEMMKDWLGLHHWESQHFFPTQFITHIFMHADLWHLFNNMLSLFFFGTLLEQVWGSKKFYIFYFATGLGASLLFSGVRMYEMHTMHASLETFMASPNPDDFFLYFKTYAPHMFQNEQFDAFMNSFDKAPTDPAAIESASFFMQELYTRYLDVGMMGASGAVFGLLIGIALIFPNIELYLFLIPVGIKAKYYVLFYGALEVYRIIENRPDDNVAHFAHLGGLLIGFILIKIWGEKPRV
ncbi:MAG: rhomboid family intramembrane serine protease [Cytophagales bacterium]|nr:MAG: rhomboid family intramembrane serine protease [Cytophagales bacterium]TAF61470.1 MAG: rhomboid family intramembrane serine protease [Cytophagales bacterium]